MLHTRHLVLAAVAGCLATPAAFATNRMLGHGYGTKIKRLAGATAALPQDAMAAATNPAGMVFVGDRMDLGSAFFNPSRLRLVLLILKTAVGTAKTPRTPSPTCTKGKAPASPRG